MNQALNLSNDLVLGEDDWRSDNVGSSKIKDHWINNQLGGRCRVRWGVERWRIRWTRNVWFVEK
ncbi:MAG: hypothetical protein CMN54_04800 [SAR324 cluster bacterium]|uniref:Uncharacterized protein n=1 Tax=SAR324 cluster bacterium TaxID=2024889 RepID=A0A2D6YHV5_9DELT|nr:hypothetical protein [SAR324 cluster bacterium]